MFKASVTAIIGQIEENQNNNPVHIRYHDFMLLTVSVICLSCVRINIDDDDDDDKVQCIYTVSQKNCASVIF